MRAAGRMLTGLGLASTAGASYSFLGLGDWGGSSLGGFHPSVTSAVAKAMADAASASGARFVANIGDNFYYCGIQNTSDVQINTDYLSVYTAPSLQVPWYSILGNHEYGYNVDAQVQFTNVDPSKRWYMPARYWSTRLELATNVYMTIIAIDSNPCVKDYRADSPSKWDPCSTDFPDCSPNNEGPCRFHENILSQDCSAQFDWFKKQLAAVNKGDWLVILGHHPADEIDVEDFTGAMQAHGFDLYINGHVHTLQQYSVDGNSAFVTTGAGSMVRTVDQVNDERCLAADLTSTTNSSSGHSYKNLWTKKVAGFTRHTFSDDFQQLNTEYISTSGEVLHSFSVTKGGGGGGGSCDVSSYPCEQSCTYVHKRNEAACGVAKYGCYDCSKLSPGCPECSGDFASTNIEII